MNNQGILTKAIQKAIDGGWTERSQFLDANSFTFSHNTLYGKNNKLWYFHLNEIIFNHNFCKSLWGEEPAYYWHGDIIPTEPDETAEPMWQYHLQQMVIAEDPIKYLGENI